MATERRAWDTAARIRAAADELFCRHGFAGVSVGDIAARAGVPKASVFYHFASKEALFERVLEGYYEAHREALHAAYAGEGTRRERLHRMIDAYLDFIAANRRYAALIQHEVASSGTHPLIARHLAPLFEWIAEVLSDVAPEKGPLAARHFFVTFSGMVINYFTYAPVLGRLWGVDPSAAAAREERRAHLHWMVDTVLAGLAAEAKPKRRR